MDITWARKLYKTTPISNIPMRVVHYDRVSSDTEEQLNSLANQNSFNEDYIKQNPHWTYCGKYVDEGITGISTKKREDFNRLIEDAKNGKFDFIITKEISRFARNTVDSIKYTRELLSYGVCVFFQNDNINTIEEDSEFRLTIMAGVAQEEVRKLSSRVKYGHKQAIKNGTILGRDIYGYIRESKTKYVYDEKYKPMIEFIFEKYASEELSTSGLEKKLYDMGYRSFQGKKIDSTVIKHIITNPKYKGFYCGGKVQIVDMFTKKQKFLEQDEWVQYDSEGSIPPIVPEELWEQANNIYKKRSEVVKSKRTSIKKDNLFTGKIFCENDGAVYWLSARKSRTKKNDNDPVWSCSNKRKNGTASCESMRLYEKELICIVIDIIKNDICDDDIIDEYVNIYKSVNEAVNYDDKISSVESDIRKIIQKKEKILDYNLDGKISDRDFVNRNKMYDKELEEKEKLIESFKKKTSLNNNIEKTISNIFKQAKKLHDIKCEDINRQMIDLLFSKIYAKPIDKTHTQLTFVLNTGESETFLYDRNNMLHSGYMVKIISPERNISFERHMRSVISHHFNVFYTYLLAI